MYRNDILFCCVDTADVCLASRFANFANFADFADFADIVILKGKERNGNGDGRIFKDAKHPEDYEYEYHDCNPRYGVRPNKYNVGVSQYRQGESRVFCEGCKERDFHVAD
jgi:hypothetical protein